MSKTKSNYMVNKLTAPKIAIAAAFMLAVLKGVVGFVSGSLAIVGSAVDSLLDMVASFLNYIMIRKGDEPPDSGHAFGHGKFEAYASLLQSLLIFSTGGYLLYTAVKKFASPEIPRIGGFALSVMLVSVFVSLFITIMLRTVAEREQSQALKADSVHYAVDVLGNGAVLISLLIIKFTSIVWVDSVFGAVVAVYIMISAAKLHIPAIKILLDKTVDKAQLTDMLAVLDEYKSFYNSYHKLRTRTDGTKVFADIHIQLCKKLSLQQSHEMVHMITAAMKAKNENIDVTAHAEPCDGTCEDTSRCTFNETVNFLESRK